MSNQIAAPRKRTKGARLAHPPRKEKQFMKVVLAATLVLVLCVVGALTYGLAFYNKIYPHVSVGDVSLGGLTQKEAESLLEERLQQQYGAKTLTLQIADQETVLTTEQAGLRFKTTDPARRAWDYGREGGFFSRIGVVIASLFVEKEFPLGEELYIDENVVAATIGNTAQKVDIPAVAAQVEKMQDEILITVGSAGRVVDQTVLTALVIDRLTRGDFSPLSYEPTPTKPQPVDLEALYEQNCFPARNAQLDPDAPPGDLSILPEQDGITFDQEAAQQALTAAAPGELVRIPLVTIPAEISAAKLQSKLFTDELSSFTTYLNASNKARASNIKLSASLINGTILRPGDEFSFNGIVGERTTSRGFQQAGAYVNGRLVDEVGGGICQMSTTIYGAALRANLKITSRSNHSMTVAYVPIGQDATVNWGTIDFKFQNDMEYPVKILAEQSGSSVKVTIVGTKVNDYTVSIESKELSRTPYETKTVSNPDLAPGTKKVTMDGHTGYTAESYRVIKDKNGNVISRKLEAKSKYNKVDQIVEVGPGGSTPKTPTPSTPTPSTQPSTQPPEQTPEDPVQETEPPETPEPEPPDELTEQPEGDPGDVWG